MKRIISLALTVVLFCSVFAFATVAEDTKQKREFVVDGNLDVWYLEQEFDYYFPALDPYMKSDGKSPYDLVETDARVWTAYDDTYVYFYIKVWDEELVAYDKEGAHAGLDSSAGDSIEIWFDPDPDSQGKYNPNITADDRNNYFCNNTKFAEQGDIRFRMQGANFMTDDYHNVESKVGYPVGSKTSEWINNRENVCPFSFSGEDNGNGLTSGYGLEVRFPRNDDDRNSYLFNVAVNNSAEFSSERYALALGAAWWISYSASIPVTYEETNPFLTQDYEGKTVKYTESVRNAKGQAVVDKIAALTENADKASVEEAYNQFQVLSALQKGYVVAKNFDALKTAGAAAGVEIVDPDLYNYEDVTTGGNGGNSGNGGGGQPQPAPEYTPGDVDDNDEINAVDALWVLQAAVEKRELDDNAFLAGDMNKDETLDATDALAILKLAVGK